MKKYIIILISIFMLAGCNKVKQFYLNEDDYKKAEIINLTDVELKEKEEAKDSFAILVYTPGCITCANFESVLNQYSELNNLTFYSISTEYFENTSIYKYIKHTPSLVLYNNGKISYYLDPDKDKDTESYLSVDNFDKWFRKYILFK